MYFPKVTLVEINHTFYNHSTTLFMLGLSNIVYCITILHLLKKENKTWRVLDFLTLSVISTIVFTITIRFNSLNFLSNWSSTSTLKDLKTSRDQDFLSINERVIVYKHNKIYFFIPWIPWEGTTNICMNYF